MKKLLGMLSMVVLVAGFSGLAGTRPAAAQEYALVTVNLHMRAGPGTRYPVIVTIPERRNVRVFGCVRGYTWCDVAWAGHRGWVYARYLAYMYHDRRRPIARLGPVIGLPIITFSFGDYAHRHYRDRPWYPDLRDRHRPDRRYHRGRNRDRRDHDRDRDRPYERRDDRKPFYVPMR